MTKFAKAQHNDMVIKFAKTLHKDISLDIQIIALVISLHLKLLHNITAVLAIVFKLQGQIQQKKQYIGFVCTNSMQYTNSYGD